MRAARLPITISHDKWTMSGFIVGYGPHYCLNEYIFIFILYYIPLQVVFRIMMRSLRISFCYDHTYFALDRKLILMAVLCMNRNRFIIFTSFEYSYDNTINLCINFLLVELKLLSTYYLLFPYQFYINIFKYVCSYSLKVI